MLKVFLLTFIINLSIGLGFSATASVDKNRCTIDDIISFKIEFENADSFSNIDISSLIKDFAVISGPSQQTSMQWINGKVTNSRIMSWSLSPKREGRLVIPRLNVQISGKKSATKEIVVFVSQSQKKETDLDVFISAEINKESVYIGEQITLTYSIYRKVECSIEPFEIPKFPGFWSEELFRPNQIKFKNIAINGVQYQKGILYKVALFPISGKELEIEPLSLKIQKQKKKKRRSRDPFFDPFFDSFFTETETKILRSKKREIFIKDYPQSRPIGFTGAVGDFKISTATDTDSINVNEAITFRVIVEGTGNMGLFTIPKMSFADDIDQFPPKENFEKNVFRDELSGKMIWEYILVPRVSGKLSIPPISFTFFNPKIEKWQKISSKPISVFVKNTNDNYLTSNGLTKREIEVLGKDIKYIYNGNPVLKHINSTPYNYIFLIYFLSILIFFLPNILSYIIGYNLDSMPARLSKNALKKALNKLKTSDTRSDNFDNKIIYQYLKDKFQLHSSNLDAISTKDQLRGRINDQSLEELIELLKLYESFIYGKKETIDIHSLNQKTASILERIDKSCL
ncbi:protein BatD [bacterium]|nr:MAG: protein BatD [bacterium]